MLAFARGRSASPRPSNPIAARARDFLARHAPARADCPPDGSGDAVSGDVPDPCSASRLPRGRHGLSPEHVAESQRWRLLVAAVRCSSCMATTASRPARSAGGPASHRPPSMAISGMLTPAWWPPTPSLSIASGSSSAPPAPGRGHLAGAAADVPSTPSIDFLVSEPSPSLVCSVPTSRRRPGGRGRTGAPAGAPRWSALLRPPVAPADGRPAAAAGRGLRHLRHRWPLRRPDRGGRVRDAPSLRSRTSRDPRYSVYEDASRRLSRRFASPAAIAAGPTAR